MDPFTIGAIGLGVGNFVGSLFSSNSSLKAQREANAANIAMNRETNKANDDRTTRQMVWQEQMSNTAYERAMDDMKRAGLNPMLAYQQGGAGTPNASPIAAQAGHVEPAVDDRLGASLKALGASAGSIVQLDNQLKDSQTSRDVGAARAATEIAQAKNLDASAQATRARMPIIAAEARSAGSEADARAAEAAVRKATAEFDKNAVKYDGWSKRVLEGLGGAVDAVSLRRMLQGISNSKRDQTMKEETHLRNQGIHGSRLP